MKALKPGDIKAPEGYVYNQFMVLTDWEYAKVIMKKEDDELFDALKISSAKDRQAAYTKYCREFLEKWHYDFKLDNVTD